VEHSFLLLDTITAEQVSDSVISAARNVAPIAVSFPPAAFFASLQPPPPLSKIRSEVVPKSVLLAHVLVHEITHILQGTEQHSGSGIMKAVWTHQDHLQMLTGALPFTPQDVEMIHRGLAARASGVSPLATGIWIPQLRINATSGLSNFWPSRRRCVDFS
jgi:hypothetical protein